MKNNLFVASLLTLCVCGATLLISAPAVAVEAGTSVTILPADNSTYQASSGQSEADAEEWGQVLGEKVYEQTGEAVIGEKVKSDLPTQESVTGVEEQNLTVDMTVNKVAKKSASIFPVIILLLVLSIGAMLLLLLESKKSKERRIIF